MPRVCTSTSGRDAEIRRRIQTKLESRPSLTILKLTEDCQKIEIIKKNSKDIESGILLIKKSSQINQDSQNK